jgi:hypothetical protein
LLDRLTPTIAELTAGIEQEVEKCPAAQRLQTHPGVGALTALPLVWQADREVLRKRLHPTAATETATNSTKAILSADR